MPRKFVSGASQFLSVASALGLAPPFSMCCWFNANTSAATAGIINIGNFSAGYEIRQSGQFVQCLSASTAVNSPNKFALNVWNHACMTTAATNNRNIYLNGVKTNNTVNISATPVAIMSIGRTNSTVFSFTGLIGEVAFWNVTLTDAEVLLLSQGFSVLSVRPKSLIAYYPLTRNGLEYNLNPLTFNQNNLVATSNPPLITGYNPPLIQLPESMLSKAHFLFQPGPARTSPETISVSGTWVCPAGISSIDVECWGGGGGAGGGGGFGGAGGGGAYSKKLTLSVIAGNSYTVVVGTGGPPGSAGNDGTNGNDSYFIDTSTVLAKGGHGGSGGGVGVADGLGGASSSGVGTTKYSGGNGGSNSPGNGGGGGSSAGTGSDGVNGANGIFSGPGAGGTAPSGGGNGGNGAVGVASPGSIPGGGGGGSGTSADGAAGANGKVVVTFPGTSASTIVFRKTFSGIGTRVGTRQTMGW